MKMRELCDDKYVKKMHNHPFKRLKNFEIIIEI